MWRIKYIWTRLRPLLTTIGAVVVIIGIASFGIYKTLEKVETEGHIQGFYYVSYLDIDVWTAVRKTNQYSLEENAWDVTTTEVCDEYEEECTKWAKTTKCIEKDHNGRCTKIKEEEYCVETRKADCIRSHYEYDYNIFDWRDFQEPDTTVYNQPEGIYPDDKWFHNMRKFRIDRQIRGYYLTIHTHDKTYTYKTNKTIWEKYQRIDQPVKLTLNKITKTIIKIQ